MSATWAYQTTTTTGTGNLTLAAVSGYPQFNDVPALSAGARFPYAILDNATKKPIEAGIGYLSSSTVLVREKVLATYSGGTFDDTSPSAVSLAAGTYDVICAPLAEMVPEAGKWPNRNASFGLQKVVYSEHIAMSQSGTGMTISANTLYLTPFKLGARVECDALGVRVGGGAASSSIRLGLWEIAADGHPGKLLGQTSALSSATGGVDVIGTLGSTITLNPGWYYVGLVSDGAPSIYRLNPAGESYAGLGPAGGNMALVVAAMTASFTFGSLPNPAPSTGLSSIAPSAAYPTVGMRCV